MHCLSCLVDRKVLHIMPFLLLWLTLHAFLSHVEPFQADGAYELVKPATLLKPNQPIQLWMFTAIADQDLHCYAKERTPLQGKHGAHLIFLKFILVLSLCMVHLHIKELFGTLDTWIPRNPSPLTSMLGLSSTATKVEWFSTIHAVKRWWARLGYARNNGGFALSAIVKSSKDYVVWAVLWQLLNVLVA